MTAAPAHAAHPRRRIAPSLGILRSLPAVLLLVGGLLIPISIFFVYSFWEADLFGITHTWNLDNYRAVFTDSFSRDIIIRTHAIGLLTALVTVTLAFFTAHAIAFSLRRGRNVVLFAIVISMLASYLVRVFAWRLILGPSGVINQGLELVGLIDEPLGFLIYGKLAVALTLIDILLPIAVLPIYASMQAVDRDVLAASRDLGLGPVRTLLRVTLPLTWAGVSAAFVVVYILAASDYVTTELIGGKNGIMVGRLIYDQFGISHDWPYAAALAFVTIWSGALIFAALFALRALVRLGIRRHRARPPREHPRLSMPALPQLPHLPLPRVPWARIYLGLILVYLFLPLAVVILFSFSDSTIAAFPIRGVTGHWYAEAFGGEAFRSALGTSVKLAAFVTVTCVVCGILAAFALERSASRLRRPLFWVLFLPLATPAIMLGFSILTLVTELDRQPSLVSAWLGQSVYLLPFAVLVIAARLVNFDRSIEEAGRDLGHGPVGTFRHVTWPLLLPSVVGVAILTFALSLDEFVVTLYTVGANTTLPILIWSTLQKESVTPAINAIATVLMVATTTCIVGAAAAARWRARGGGRWKLSDTPSD